MLPSVRRWLGASALVVLLMGIAACSGGGGHHAAAPAATATSSTAPTSAAATATPSATAPVNGSATVATATPTVTNVPTSVPTATTSAVGPSATPTGSGTPATPSATATVAASPTSAPTCPVMPTSTAPPVPTSTPTLPPTATITETPLTGPVVTAFGVADGSGTVNPPGATDAQGRPIFQKQAGSGFIVYVEGRSLGTTSFPVGTSRFTYSADDPTGQPDVQIESSNALGNGSADVCDSSGPTPGGIPAIDPPDFRPISAVSNALNDFACRFRVFTQPDFACTQDSSANLAFANASSTTQFCVLINDAIVFPAGDTILTARLKDNAGHAGPSA